MSRELLKCIAMVTMVIDHSAMMGLAETHYLIFRIIGRLAFPIFAFQIAVGFDCTKHKPRYLATMGLCALLSELPYNLSRGHIVYPEAQNVLFTFFIALLALYSMEHCHGLARKWTKKKSLKTPIVLPCTLGIVCGCIAAVAYWLGNLIACEYAGLGVLLVISNYAIMHLLPKRFVFLRVVLLALAIAVSGYFVKSLTVAVLDATISIQLFATFASIPIAGYLLTGEKKASTEKLAKWHNIAPMYSIHYIC